MSMYLNVAQVASALRVSERSVERWARREGLPCITDRAWMLFDRAQVARWAAARSLGATQGFLAPEFHTGVRLGDLLDAGGIERGIAPETAATVIEGLVSRRLGDSEAIRFMAAKLRAPGGIVWTNAGHGTRLAHLAQLITLGAGTGMLAVLLLAEPVSQNIGASDPQAAQRIIWLGSPSPRSHLELLRRLGQAAACGDLDGITAAASDSEIRAIVDQLAPHSASS